MATEEILVKRDATDIPFGFKLQGGADFSTPLSILQVTPNSIAERCGLKEGDAIVKINQAETSWMEHARAKQELIRSGNEFILTVQRNAVDTAKVQLTPLSELRSNPPQKKEFYTQPPPPPKTNLTVEKPEPIAIGSSHNRAPMPFNAGVGSTIDYKAAKPDNWKPGDYTQWTENNQNGPSQSRTLPNVTAVYHNQYNSPMGIYSDSNVLQEFQNQTKGLIPEPEQKRFMNTATTSTFQNQNASPNYLQQLNQPSKQPRGTNSLSMHMLTKGIDTAASTNTQPPSIFDLKRGENPTGASVPRGFRSVAPPAALPAEQRHAPMRKEYQVQHVKQNWIEPKIN